MARKPNFDLYVLADTSTDYGRRILRGAAHYAAHRRVPWRVGWGGWPTQPLAEVARGILALVTNEDDERRLLRAGIPAVNYSSRFLPKGLPSVVPDNVAIGQLAAAYFRERLYERFGFVGITPHLYSQEREEAFRTALGVVELARAEAAGASGSANLRQFLRRLPSGSAVFAANDYVARQVVHYARAVGRSVPEEVAVLGVDAEELLSLTSGISLSSIDPGFERIGFEAARCLDGLLAGSTAPRGPLRLPPAGVVERASTGAYGAGDPLIRQAMQLIGEEACQGLRAAEVARRLGVSRRRLEFHFHAAGAPGIHAAIRAERLRRAQQLLRESDLRVFEIAERCGFHDVYYFSATFKRRFGQSPLAYRRAYQLV